MWFCERAQRVEYSKNCKFQRFYIQLKILLNYLMFSSRLYFTHFNNTVL